MDMKIGMIGLDTSHCGAFIGLLNYPDNEFHVPGCRVVAAYPGGSQLCACSRDRVGKYTEQMRDEHGIEIRDTLEELTEGMDAFLLESVDGRQHLEQFKVLAEAGKPVFVDKPLTCSAAKARELAALAEAKGVPLMSASSIRYAAGIAGLLPDGAQVNACEAFGAMSLQDDYPAYFWYGVHSAEVLFSYMGSGCASVQTLHEEHTDLLAGRWSDGRIGTVRGTRFEGGAFGCTVYTGGGVVHGLMENAPPPYAMMLKEVVEFFRTGQSPIAPAETVEVMAFLDAAEQSRQANGAPVALADV